MPPIHRKLDRGNSRFITLREWSGAAAIDAFATPTDALIYALLDGNGQAPTGGTGATDAPIQTVQIVDANSNEKLKLYWSGTTPGGTADLSVWIRTSTGAWIQQGATQGAIPSNTYVEFDVHGASQFFVLLLGGPTGNDLRIFGMGFND